MSGSSRSFAAMLCTSTTLISQPFWPSRAWQKWAKTNVMFHQMLLRSHARSCATRQRESPGLVNFADKKTASRYVITLAGDTQRPQGAIRAVEEPSLERDVEILADITDDEAESDEGSLKLAGHVDEPMSSGDDDDDILFPKPATSVSGKKGKGKVEQVAGKKASDKGHGQAATKGMKCRRDGSDDEAESSKTSTKAPRH